MGVYVQGPPGPTGPEGPPGEVTNDELDVRLGAYLNRAGGSMTGPLFLGQGFVPAVDDMAAPKSYVDRLETRIADLERALTSLRFIDLSADVSLQVDGADVILANQVLPLGTYSVSARVSAELVGVSSAARVVTLWIEAIGAIEVVGPRAAQITVHQALPFASLAAGPARFHVTGAGNAILYARVDPVPGQAAAFDRVLIKAATSLAPVHPGASGLIASGAVGPAAEVEVES